MNIATLNTWKHDGPYKDRWNVLLEELQEIDPDVLCLQEVFEPTLTEKIKARARLPYSAACPEFGLAIITKHPMISSQILKYKTVSQIENERRGAVLAAIQIGQEKVVFANTHLSWKLEDGPVRLGQVRELIEAVLLLKQPAFLAGDFNDIPESAPIEEIEGAGYQDLYKRRHPGGKGMTWDNQNPYIQSHSIKFPDRRIDFLFLHNDLLAAYEIQACEIIFNRPNQNNVYPSDHYGVIAKVKTKSAG